MKKTLLASILFVATLTSCGNKENKEEGKEITVKAKATQIKGDLGDYFEVVDKEYKIPVKETSSGQLITVELKRKDKDFPFSTDKLNQFGTNGGEEYHVGFGIELLGDNGPVQVNSATEGGMSGTYSSEDVPSLFKLKKGETGFVRWSVNNTEGIKTFQLTSALQKEDGSKSVSSSSSNEQETTTSTGSKNWDAVLADYEKYVDDYVVLYKKAKKGDATALQEYPAIMQKAQDLQKSLEDAKNDKGFTATQASKMMKIQTKMLQAIQ